MPSDIERFRKLVDYDPVTGVFTWSKAVKPWPRRLPGSVAGGLNKHGYWEVRTSGMRAFGHRLAWAFMTGEWPQHIVDHIDTDRANNAWSNLRAADPSESSWNTAHRVLPMSGVKGVSWHELAKKWDVRVCVRGQLFRERHALLADAEAAAIRLRNRHHGQYANHKSLENCHG
ncbi:HNH endonuclease [Burkholderia cenocepacia]|uniref:HNH endonuclease n=2 Tax=Burkholderia cenocepacia TaxID=95486 RepID=UPI002232C214|nr:HNH endonuclease [Burkholderia cenocepacia]